MRKACLLFLVFSSLSFSFGALANKIFDSALPANILSLDSRFGHHVILVEKSTQTLYLFKNQDQVPELVKTYKIATGKSTGDKKYRGDYKTPEGVYRLQKFLSDTELQAKYGDEGKIYGAGAFTTNYPNIIDLRAGKTGGGIWLHSTDDDSRVSKGLDSRGCVVVVDSDLKDISRYIELNKTPIIIVQDMYLLPKKTWLENRNNILGMIEEWRKAWAEESFDQYISMYDNKDFRNSKGGYNAFKNYKRAVFNNPGTPSVEFRNISVFVHENYAVVKLEQDYISTTIKDIGQKTLYLKKDGNYSWKIISETWEKIDNPTTIAFRPSLQFFKQ